MELVLSFLMLFATCAGESYWQLQLSPESIGSVPYGNSHISVWEHATWKGRYFAMPIVCLQSEATRMIHNPFTGQTELKFDVLLWSREARETVHNFLTSHINASIVEEQIELLPMERIRIVWRGQPLPDYYQLSDRWRSNTHLPTVVTFSVTCQNNDRCQELQTAIRTSPDVFGEMELEYEINSQRSARRRLTVEGRHLVGGSLYASLESMPVMSPIRYLRSQDVKRLTAETLTNVISSQVTDHDYVDTDDEISMSDLLQRVFDQTKVSTDDFQPVMWQSVYWNPDNARPDKITSYMNKVVSRNATNNRNLSINQNQRSTAAETGFSFFGLFGGGGGGGSSSTSSVRKENLLQTLRERDVAVQWTGERFVPKPLQLSRLNIATLNTSTNIATSYVQIRRHDSVQSIKLRVRCDASQTSRLTPELVEARVSPIVERFINESKTEQNKLAGVLQTMLNVMNGLKERSEATDSLSGGPCLKARDITMTNITDSSLQGYCYRPGYYCTHFPSSSVRIRGISLESMKARCDEDAACVAFNDYSRTPEDDGVRIFHEPCASTHISRHSQSKWSHYVKISKTAQSYIDYMNRKLSEITQSTHALKTTVLALSDLQHAFLSMPNCKHLGEDYRYQR